jgi:hypothetical protein
MIIHDGQKISKILSELNEISSVFIGTTINNMEMFHKQLNEKISGVLASYNLDYVAWKVIGSREKYIMLFELDLNLEEDKIYRSRKGKVLALKFVLNDSYIDSTDVVVDEFTNITNRSNHQTKFLLDLLNGSFNNIQELENKIKNNFVFYCPGDLLEIETVLSLPK